MSRAAHKNVLKFCRGNEMRIKKRHCSLSLGNTTVSRCLDDNSILKDNVIMLDQKYEEVLHNSKFQAHSVAIDPMLRRTNFSFP